MKQARINRKEIGGRRKDVDDWTYSKWLTIGSVRGLKKVIKRPVDYSPTIVLVAAFLGFLMLESIPAIVNVLGLFVVFILNPTVVIDLYLWVINNKRPDIFTAIFLFLVLILFFAMWHFTGWIFAVGIYAISIFLLLMGAWFYRKI